MIILWLFVIVSLLLIVIGCYALLVVASDADDREELIHEYEQKTSVPGNGEHDGLLGDDYTGGICEQPDRVDSEE